jgi:hypothetical protein
MSETNANNIIIRILYNGKKGSYSLSLDRLLRLFYKTTRPFEYRDLSSDRSYSGVDISIGLLLAIPQSVQTKKCY